MTTQVRTLLACAGMAATFAASRPARAGDDAGALRYTTVFEETIEGQARKASVAEAELVGLLLKDGVTFVDEAQSRKIRSVTSAGKASCSQE
jgi:hypothetical protein